jgi:hypothetical protein
MSDLHDDVILRILTMMKIQCAFLSDALTRSSAILKVLEDQGLLQNIDYIDYEEQARALGDCSLPSALAKEIDEMIQTISGKGSIQ